MSENVGDTMHPGGGGPSSVKQRRPRLRLNCSECRGKKLSCDRKLPCQRCVRAGKPDLCTYEAFPPGTKTSASTRSSVGPSDSDLGALPLQQNDDQIRELQAEIAQLKEHLFQTTISHHADVLFDASDSGSGSQATITSPIIAGSSSLEFTQTSNRAYHGTSTLLGLFFDIPQLPPYLETLAEEHLRPRGMHLGRTQYTPDPLTRNVDIAHMLALLPPRHETDALVSFYLNHTEHVHRIVHTPTFEREYMEFWVQEPQFRDPGTAATILCIISIAAATSTVMPDDAPNRTMVPHWISVSAQWLNAQWQSQPCRPRDLIYYQLACLVCLAKRVNWIRQQQSWSETAPLIQNAIVDGLHLDPPHSEPLYVREVKRRIWATIKELDLQASFEHGLPTILSALESTTLPPANIDDCELHETSKSLPGARPANKYTKTSYQSISAQSFTLRLEISQRLFAAGNNKIAALPGSEVQQYTRQLTQALDSLPAWTMEGGAPNDVDCGGPRKAVLMVWALLQYQLRECLILLHRPFVHPVVPPAALPTTTTSDSIDVESSSWPQVSSSSSSLSETIIYHSALSILFLTRKLAVMGTMCVTSMRNDLTLACLALCLVTLARPKGSLSIPIINSAQTIGLLDDVLPFFEGWFMRCSHNTDDDGTTTIPVVMMNHVAHAAGRPESAAGGTGVITGGGGGGSRRRPSSSNHSPAAWRVLMIYSVLIITKIHVGKDDEARAFPCSANRFSEFWNAHVDRRFERQQEGGELMGVVGGEAYHSSIGEMWAHGLGGEDTTMNENHNHGRSWNFEMGQGRMGDPLSLVLEQAGW
ncbi:hypothetical protein QBC37DRAFT_396370 [Rhypophila decipiens]|uniref:Zn(2)-C6 fungal-type domain-containing protein n=1 Tax=Rhypophila decipiens TaxID=261697 RepID=A0AAN7BE83_9PEZI|nr:hypothetical protein QBC37DRAFT_396370 [Rhypophila decipiens]